LGQQQLAGLGFRRSLASPRSGSLRFDSGGRRADGRLSWVPGPRRIGVRAFFSI
jgi:hypothetical protein